MISPLARLAYGALAVVHFVFGVSALRAAVGVQERPAPEPQPEPAKPVEPPGAVEGAAPAGKPEAEETTGEGSAP